ncbi:hypothetical protein F5Y19DRAFT_492466 [Xylariaceae sp. FL1651]|nr:hypothetical protein F5Y19DRAFT_492466 [Xylariaceae sp. FL1651]
MARYGWMATTTLKPPRRQVTAHDMELSPEERTARIIWVVHILSYLTKGRSHTGLQQPHADDEEELDGGELDAITEVITDLSESKESIRFRILDCVAQLLSPSKGWGYVVTTALREREDFVEIDVARNDCFGITGEKLENYLSTTTQHDAHEGLEAPQGEFESAVIAYTERRIDHWVHQLRTLLGNGPKRRNRKKKYLSKPVAQSWANLRNLLYQEAAGTAKFREKIVGTAYKCALSPEIREFLQNNLQSTNGRKIWYALKSLARPISDCRLLRHIAIRHPQFQNARICPIRLGHKTTIRPEYQVDIADAWSRLIPGDASPSPLELGILTGFGERFRLDCERSYSLHSEMQLFTHYEGGAALPPTLNYFGCSKKACLLCESFLQALPRPVATRGRHGICYAAWGVPPSRSIGTMAALKELEEMLISRTRMNQSTVASAYSDSIVQDLLQRAERAESAKQAETALRERRHIQQGHNSTTQALDPSLPESKQASCVMCNKRPATLCKQCRSCNYCSRKCQEGDWPSHKLLCRGFSEQSPRPSPTHKRAILFPTDRLRPQMIWIPCELEEESEDEGCYGKISYEIANLYPYLGTDKPFSGTILIQHNPIRGRELGSGTCSLTPQKTGYEIALRFREAFLVDGSNINRSILASVGASGIVPHKWSGPVIAMRQTWSELYEDITLADYRHTLDYLMSYGATETRESDRSEGRPPTAVRGVKICCYGEQKLHGSERYVAVDVPSGHPTRTVVRRGSISPISQHFGMPLRLWKYPDIEAWLDPPGWHENIGATSNQDAAFLMMETNPGRPDWGFAPIDWGTGLGNVLAIREDGKDLAVDNLRAICHFIRKKLMLMFEDANGYGSVKRTKQQVVDFITWDNRVKFNETTGDDDSDSRQN